MEDFETLTQNQLKLLEIKLNWSLMTQGQADMFYDIIKDVEGLTPQQFEQIGENVITLFNKLHLKPEQTDHRKNDLTIDEEAFFVVFRKLINPDSKGMITGAELDRTLNFIFDMSQEQVDTIRAESAKKEAS
jgi:hypothetical protein